MEATQMAARGSTVHHQTERKQANTKQCGWLKSEKSRVRVELRNSHHISPNALPPSGVLFDVVPNVADEFAYDALEKAYNAAFEVCSPERRARSHRDCGNIPFTHTTENSYINSRDHYEGLKTAAPVLMDRKARAINPMLLAIAADDMRWWETEQPGTRQRWIQRLKHERQGAFGQVEYQTTYEITEEMWKENVIRCQPSVFDKAVLMSEKRVKKTQVLLELATACRQRYIASQTREEQLQSNPTQATASRPHAQTSVTKPTNSVVVQTPVGETTADLNSIVLARPTDSLMSAPDENKALDDFLVVELSLFVACLLQDRWDIPDVDHLAAVTSIQICRNHRRAVADFDAERNRVQARAIRNRVLEGITTHKESIKRVSVDSMAVVSQVNPFQLRLRDQVNASDELWRDVMQKQHTHSSAEHTINPLEHNGVMDTTICVELDGLRKRGLNALLLHDADPSQAVLQVRSLLASNAYPGPHLVITSTDSLDRWHHTLVASIKCVFPCSSSQVDRLPIYRRVAQDSVCGETLIVLVSFDDLQEDGIALALGPWQSCIVDLNVSTWRSDAFEAAWLCLLAIPSRQRVLLCNETLTVDVRLLVQFLFPSLLSSRRKLMAWNCAAFDELSIQAICTVVVSCAVVVGGRVSREALQLHLVKATRTKSSLELTTLDTLQREGMVKSCADVKPEKLSARNPRPWSGRPTSSNGTEVRKKLHKRVLSPAVVASELLKQSPRAKKIPPRRRGAPNETTPRSRKRISRCGKCAGCLAEDCMVCGHCQDMKKYGGPGLRKQSCKHRKCMNPKSWGLTSKKSRRGTKDRLMDCAIDSGAHAGGSDRDDSETDEFVGVDAEDGGLTDSSQESDPHPPNVVKVIEEGSSSTEILDLGKKMKVELPLPAVDEDEDDSDGHDTTSSGTEGGRDRSRSNRTRVMRCGKCKGCTSGDCMTCNHCLDMKKYGGPGLRKQSCKNRKCVVPKVVMLNNQAKEDGESFEDQDDTVFNEVSKAERPSTPSSKSKTPTEQVEQWTHKPQSNGLHMEQECMAVVRRQLRYPCGLCSAAFSTSEQRTYHNTVRHSTDKATSDWECEADRLLQHPRYQLGLILTSVGLTGGQVRAYAKLKGDDFEYYLLCPQIVLGRMSARWNDLYLQCGIDDVKGLSAGAVDCHIGHDTMIASQHVRISWDAKEKSFMIECLSFRSPISINGRELRYGGSPLKLRSRDFVQIGASTFYFLLPRMDSEHLKRNASTAIPLAEMQQWLQLRVSKYRVISEKAEMRDRDIQHNVVHTRLHLT